MPSTPPAPASIDFIDNSACGMTSSPFTGQQTTYFWGYLPMNLTVSMPPMPYAVAQAWATFFQSLQGQNNVFQFTASFVSAYANDIGASITTTYWRLKSNARKYSVSEMRMYGFTFECVEAL